MKCPLCDGTVVNGRCKECGMPYRNDEILYHLNESRSDHYRHASDKARKIMQAQQRAGTARMNGGSRSASVSKGSSRTTSRQTFKEQQRQIRQEAMRKMMDTGNTARTTAKTVQKSWGTNGNARTMNGQGQSEKKKKRSWIGILCAILTILAVLAPLINDLGDVIKETVESELSNSGTTETTIGSYADTYFESIDYGDGYKNYRIAAGYGLAEAGDEFEPGTYGVFTVADKVTLTVNRKGADSEQYVLRESDDTIELTFEEGDTIEVESEESDMDRVVLMEE